MLARLRRQIAREAEIVGANARLQEAQRLARLGDWSFDLAREEFLWSEDLCTMYGRASARARVRMQDFREIVGQHGTETFRFALKQMQVSGERQEYELAARLPGLLPPLDAAAALEVSSLRSLSGFPVGSTLAVRPPLEAPHHTATAASLVGGGSGLIRPGAAARASHGVLFLDESRKS